MRRTVLSSITLMSLTALAIAIGACATAPVDDDLSGLTQDQSPATPEEENSGAKLPPSSQPKDDTPVTDAGTDAKAPAKDASPPAQDASTPPTDSGSTTGGDCDMNNPLYMIKFAATSNPTPCPCSASECCFMTLGCIAK
jgi:hypothetical protein